jgi:amidohydrolase
MISDIRRKLLGPTLYSSLEEGDGASEYMLLNHIRTNNLKMSVPDLVTQCKLRNYSYTNTVSQLPDLLKKIEPHMIEWRRHIHMYPELSNQEKETTKFLYTILMQNGLTKTQIVPGSGGIVCLIESNCNPHSKVLAIRADMDALPLVEQSGVSYSSKIPGVMHACGHDAHSAMVLATGLILNHLRDKFEGTIKLIFQPAEEEVIPPKSGAYQMIQQGVLQNPKVDAIIGLHVTYTKKEGVLPPLPEIIPTPPIKKKRGVVFGMTSMMNIFTIEIIGVGGHGSTPSDGVNAIYPACELVLRIKDTYNASKTSDLPLSINIATINGGVRYNVIPSTVKIVGSFRCYSEEELNMVQTNIMYACRHVEEKYNVTVNVSYTHTGKLLKNDETLVQLFHPIISEMNERNRVNFDDIIPEMYKIRKELGSEDFTEYLQTVPGVYYYLYASNTYDLHKDNFSLDEKDLILGVELLTKSALKYFIDSK